VSEIYVKDLTKRFGKTVAVKDLTLEIKDQEVMVLVGPSGCGKTTTLNCIAGLEKPTAGRIFFDGIDVTETPSHKRNIAMVFQSALLYPHLTGAQNIRMSFKAQKISREEAEARLAQVVRLLGIENELDKLPSQMSGGQRQRVAIAKALARGAGVLLMDEPLSNLDAALREELRSELLVLQKQLKTTMIYVTHDQVEAMVLADRIVVMQNGTICQIGTPNEVYNEPLSTFVAGFIGSPPMNFLRGTLHTGENGVKFMFQGRFIDLPQRFRKAGFGYQEGQQVLLGVRPQHIRLLPSSAEAKLVGTVYAVERLGKENVVTVEMLSGEKLKAIAPPEIQFHIGDVVHIDILLDNVFVFDAETGQNILSSGAMATNRIVTVHAESS